MKILIIAPHPDDEVLGCGGTIAKHVEAGDEVTLCIVTKAYLPDWSAEFIKQRPQEIRASNKTLGIKKTILLDLPTVKLDTLPQKELNAKIAKVVEITQPEIVYLPFNGDLCLDHRLIFESGLVALRPLKNKTKRILAYETLSETEWGQPIKAFVPDYFVDITETFSKKIEAMKAYASELKPSPHPRSLDNIEALAKVRGAAAGVKLAESFVLIREVT